VYKELTPEKAKAYIDSEGTTCPYCEATDITGRSLEVDGCVVTQTIDCENCHEQWIDVYRLVGLADSKGNRIDQRCQTCSGTGRVKPKKPCDDCDGTGFVPQLVECFHTHTYCKKGKCAIWDRDGQRCSLLTIAIHTKRL